MTKLQIQEKALSIIGIENAIDDICLKASTNTNEQDGIIIFERTEIDNNNSKRFFGFTTTLSSKSSSSSSSGQKQAIIITTTFCFLYSTWDGRVLFIDQLGIDDVQNMSNTSSSSSLSSSSLFLLLRQILSSIAVTCSCTRLTWTHYRDEERKFDGYPIPDTHHEVVTLFWESYAMKQYSSGFNTNTDTTSDCSRTTSPCSIDYRQSIIQCLNNSISTFTNWPANVTIRLSTVNDLETIQRLVQGLANFAQEPDAVTVSTNDYRIDGYDTEMPLFYCLLLDSINATTGEVYTFGIAFFYFGYTQQQQQQQQQGHNDDNNNNNNGMYLYLEDFFIEEKFRKNGHGKLVMSILAQIALTLSCTRMVWLSLNWNYPALNFYNSIGATIQHGLLTSRLANDDLQAYAKF